MALPGKRRYSHIACIEEMQGKKGAEQAQGPDEGWMCLGCRSAHSMGIVAEAGRVTKKKKKAKEAEEEEGGGGAEEAEFSFSAKPKKSG